MVEGGLGNNRKEGKGGGSGREKGKKKEKAKEEREKYLSGFVRVFKT